MKTMASIVDEVTEEHNRRRLNRVLLRLEVVIDGIGLQREFSEATDANPYGMTLKRLHNLASKIRKAGGEATVYRVTIQSQAL